MSVQLRIAPRPLRANQPVRWTFVVSNVRDTRTRLVFRSSQIVEIVLRAKNREWYRWSAGKTYALAETELWLDADEERALVVTPERLRVPRGRYELEACLTDVTGSAPSVRRAVRVV